MLGSELIEPGIGLRLRMLRSGVHSACSLEFSMLGLESGGGFSELKCSVSSHGLMSLRQGFYCSGGIWSGPWFSESPRHEGVCAVATP